MKKLFKQAIHFFIYSGIGWLMDMVIFSILNYIGIPTFISNIISSTCAATYVYFTSAKRLFVNEGKVSIKIKYFIYVFYQIIIILVASYAISGISHLLYSYVNIDLVKDYNKIIAKIIFTPVTMITNFVVCKNLIEKL